jgi:hypothetical protein
MADETERRGSCLCGTVRIAIKTTNKSVDACHCSMCRNGEVAPCSSLRVGAACIVTGVWAEVLIERG